MFDREPVYKFCSVSSCCDNSSNTGFNKVSFNVYSSIYILPINRKDNYHVTLLRSNLTNKYMYMTLTSVIDNEYMTLTSVIDNKFNAFIFFKLIKIVYLLPIFFYKIVKINSYTTNKKTYFLYIFYINGLPSKS